jgi:glycosyltransferase involved in cell wall biosynthesis
MRILHLGNPQVVPALRALGHDVRVASQLCPLLVIPGRPVDVRLLHREIAPDADAFFMVDTLGRQTLAYGIEDLPIPRLYWAIDVHLNFYWQRHYARLFDCVLSAQRDYVPLFAADGIPARWLPWGIDPRLFHDVSGSARDLDLAFVGMVDANRPKRAALVAELRRRFGLVTFGEDAAHRLSETEMARVFTSAKIVLNESVFGDVNFRTFEAMACGALLLTERTGNGLLELFAPGEHLAAYGPDDVVDLIGYYLSSAHERERIAAAGCELVATRHTMAARMATVTDWLTAGIPRRDAASTASSAFGVAAQLTVARGLSDPDATMRLAAERLRPAALGGDVEASLALADLMLAAGRDEGALAALGIARTTRPEDPRAWLLAGEVERRRGRIEAAAELWRAGVLAAPLPDALRAEVLAALSDPCDAHVWYALGLVLQAHGVLFMPGFARVIDVRLPRTAFDYFGESLKRAPAAMSVLEHAAAVLELAGRHEFARSFRERQVRLAPTDPTVRARYARVLARSYELSAAVHHARVAAVLAGEDGIAGTAAERWAAYREAGLAVLQTGAGEQAARLLAHAERLSAGAARDPVPLASSLA